MWLALRSLAWTALIPGMVAGYIPWRFFGLSRVKLQLQRPTHLLGLLAIGIGAGLLGVCIGEFARLGRGTLAPPDPPRELVVGGLYRYVRNPMYLSTTLILLGECLLTASVALLAYWAAWFALVNLVVILYEEPALRRRFGTSYEAYTRRVGRWFPKPPARHT
jgi:protein-S-isoprenylcysteine O-methyltransferase Ste14